MPASRETASLPHDGPLHEDVNRLGTLVGLMLAEQGGEGFSNASNLSARPPSSAVARVILSEALADTLAGLEPHDAESLARAFATYFQAVNIAERVHRIRRRREYQRDGTLPQPESLLDVLTQLRDQGVRPDELLGWLDRMQVEPVFTAHPTEAVRRSLLEKEQAIVRALVDNFDPTRTPQERREDDDRIYMALSSAGRPLKPRR